MRFFRTLSCVLVLGLAACGGQGRDPAATGQAASSETPPAAATEAAVIATAIAPAETTTATVAPAETAAATMAPAETTTATATPAFTLELRPVVENLSRPVHVTNAGDGSGRLFVVEKAGRIRIVASGVLSPEPFLDIAELVGSNGSEQGLFAVAFHPEYRTDGRFFVHYTDKAGDTVVARYQVSREPDVADPASAVTLLTADQPYPNHNGGQIAFGPDGYLYIGLGDGGSGGDPHGNGQNKDTLLGKILRIDVNAEGEQPYGIPADNPFVHEAGARPEIWAFGLRNPWRFSFDRQTGDLLIADVGQNALEEVDLQPAGAGGRNYGWNIMEGGRCFRSSDCDRQGLESPIAEYEHSQGCSITGGVRYRGTAVPAFGNTYFYADFCSGRIWGLSETSGGNWSSAELLSSDYSISSFGEDEAGEIYLTDLSGGGLYRLAAAE